MKCKGLLHTSVALKSQAPSILENNPFAVAVCLENSASSDFPGSSCIFWNFLLASPNMTSERKLVSRGAVDSVTGIWWITRSLASVAHAFFNSGHLLYSLQSAEPKSTSYLCQRKEIGISDAR